MRNPAMLLPDKELIERLRSGLHELERTVLGGVPHDARSLAAANRLEALTAENARLREALEDCARIAETEGVYPELNIANGGPDWFQHGKRIARAIRSRAALKGGE